MTIFGLDYVLGAVASFISTIVLFYLAVLNSYKKEVRLHEHRTKRAVDMGYNLPEFDYSITLSDFLAGAFIVFLATVLSWGSFVLVVVFIICVIFDFFSTHSEKPIIRFKLPSSTTTKN